jgi:hypothetical protein
VIAGRGLDDPNDRTRGSHTITITGTIR